MKDKILIADDEARMRRLIGDFLKAAGFRVLEAATGEEALSLFYHDTDIAAILLDVMMPGTDGMETLREIRSVSGDIPVLMLTARGDEHDVLKGYELGADEYIVKPFSPKILVAKVKAVMARSAKQAQGSYVFGRLVIDRDAYQVIVDGVSVDLSYKELELLLYLAENRGITLSRNKILDRVWSYGYDGEERTVDTHVKKLRKKLGACGDYIQTVRGVGYKFEVTT